MERGASIAQQLTLCGPGERACAAAAPNYAELNQKMMSDTGPAWDTKLSGHFTMGKAYSFTTCGVQWTNKESFNQNVTCSGNPFRIDGVINVNGDQKTIDAEIEFFDQ